MASRGPLRRTLSLLHQRSAQHLAMPGAPADATAFGYGSSLLHRLTGRPLVYTFRGTAGVDSGAADVSETAMVGKTPPRLMESSEGARTTPSVVSFTSPTNTLFGARHLIERSFVDPQMQQAAKTVPDNIVRASQVGAVVFGEMKETAESDLRRLASRAVHSHFNLAQSQATKDAARMAGLGGLGAITEPMASASLAYGMGMDSFDRRRSFHGGGVHLNNMKINRPLSPHLTVYKPQITSSLSIFHRISGAFLATMVFSSVLFLKIGSCALSFYPFYQFVFIIPFYFHWLISSVANFTLLALSYHMSNGVRHLLWDLGFFLELPKVYSSGIIMLFSAAVLAALNMFRFYFS